MIVIDTPRFPLGHIVATPGALDTLERLEMDPAALITRHASGDWGDISPVDRGLNDQAVRDGSRLLSVYKLTAHDTVWIITESADETRQRAATTLLLPSEY